MTVSWDQALDTGVLGTLVPGVPDTISADDLGDVPMRMTRVRDESGAVLVFVAVCLVVLLGMVALTVDLGRAVAIKRDMVNAADAAALAGAQVCAIDRDAGLAEADRARDLGAQRRGRHLQLLGAAVRGHQRAGRCADGHGHVPHLRRLPDRADPRLRGTTDVVASATAIWQPTGVRNPVPFVAAEGTFASDCPIGADLPVGTPCYLWFDNDDFEGSTFGTLNLNAWDVSETEDCANKEMGANEHYAAHRRLRRSRAPAPERRRSDLGLRGDRQRATDVHGARASDREDHRAPGHAAPRASVKGAIARSST